MTGRLARQTPAAFGSGQLEKALVRIAAAKTAQEVKKLADAASLAKQWYRRARLGLDIQNDAAEIRLRAERKAGELLARLVRRPGERTDRTSSQALRGSEFQAALEDAGATREHARRWQKVAAVPEEHFERAIASTRASGDELTTSVVTGSKANPISLQDRRTPRWFFDALSAELGPFAADAFAAPSNALCPVFWTKEQDALKQTWPDITFGNPEFEKMETPLAHALAQGEAGRRCVLLAPVTCAQGWCHELAIRGTIYLPDARINYDLPDGTATDGADRDTVVIAFGREHRNTHWKRGVFRVHQLRVKHLEPSLPDARRRALG